MKTRFGMIGAPLYCDTGLHEGDMRIDLSISLYLSPQEYARYEGPDSLRITLGEPVAADGNRPASRRPAGPVPAPCAPAEPASASTAKEHSDGRP